MSRNSPSVLIVDDEEDVAEVMAHDLADEYDVSTVYSGQEALEEIGDSTDIVLLDRKMPDMTGDEVLAEIRARELDVRVAMVTAAAPAFEITDMEFDAYLTKPASGEQLRTVVDELLALAAYDEQIADLYRIAEKLATLETAKPDAELAGAKEHAALQERKNELTAKMRTQLKERGDAFFNRVIEHPAHSCCS